MTKTYNAKAQGKSYTMTVTDTTAPNGGHGLHLTCLCATHAGTSGAAILATQTSADAFPKARIHGHVTMAHSPIGSRHPRIWKA